MASMAGQHGHALDYADTASELTTRIRNVMAAQSEAIATLRRESVTANRLSFDAQDPQIRMWAKRCAGEGGALIDATADAMAAQAAALNLCSRYGVPPPNFKDSDTAAQTIAKCRRCACSKWWRRRGRVMVGRRVDLAGIRAGKVCRAAAAYVTEPGLIRQRERRTSNAELLETLTATNDDGDAYTLAELSELSTANPTLRRHELMARINGLEEISEKRGDAAMFVTGTLPSEFHAVVEATNRPNPVYSGASPRDGQAWLVEKWALIRARLASLGVAMYGLRCVEPHHDGTPHWHLLIFAALKLHLAIRKAFLAVFLDEAELPKDERARAARIKHGVTIKLVNKVKGSATGYIAKYLAKNIDGHQLEATMTRGADGSLHLTSDNPVTAAERIRAWASIWGIRQFQFFGTPPVTWWRELRRAKEPNECAVMEIARATADAGEYGLHVLAVGGVCRPKNELTLQTWREPVMDGSSIKANAYGEPMQHAIKGVECFTGAVELTRLHTWTIAPNGVRPLSPERQNAIEARTAELFVRAAEFLTTRTRVNNCNHPPPESHR